MSTTTRGTTDDPGGSLIELLDRADQLPGAADLRARTIDVLDAVPGSSVVDVGCGTGCAVAEMTVAGLRAIGVDASDDMIAVARDRWPDAEFQLGDAYNLPLSDGEVAGYRADKVLHELTDPRQALVEAHRVLRPGGRAVLAGPDWDGFIIDSDQPALTRAIVQAQADALPSPYAARRYRNLLLDNGFDEVTVEIHTATFTGPAMLPMLSSIASGAATAGAVSTDQAANWVAEQTSRARTDRLFLAIAIILATARRP